MTKIKPFNSVANAISTHTLTWSVTGIEMMLKSMLKISTHTLTWSVTLCPVCAWRRALISTHTLTWSVTK